MDGQSGFPFIRLDAKLKKRRPLYTLYSLDTLCSNDRFSHDKATAELGYRPRDLYETVKDTVLWLRRQGILKLRKKLKINRDNAAAYSGPCSRKAQRALESPGRGPFSSPRASARRAKGLPHTGEGWRARPAALRQAGLERLVIGARRLAGCACTGRAFPGPAAKGRKRRAPYYQTLNFWRLRAPKSAPPPCRTTTIKRPSIISRSRKTPPHQPAVCTLSPNMLYLYG